ncbi:MAG: hypothetical protein VX730_09035 [Pseudomonadota bacterium]|nr:hypothetical protein [Pseudomonadota bacterium]
MALPKVLENTVKISAECAEALQANSVFHGAAQRVCEETGARLMPNPNLYEMSGPSFLGTLIAHKAEGDLVYVREIFPGQLVFGYRFDGKGGMRSLHGSRVNGGGYVWNVLETVEDVQ